MLDELGPLDPNWFEELTRASSTKNGTTTDQDALRTNPSRGHGGGFKSPSEKCDMDSQLISTPKIFRSNRVHSPESEEDLLLSSEKGTSEKGTTLEWTGLSPCLFGSLKDGMYKKTRRTEQDSFELLDTPKKSAIDPVRRITESLGAQIDPDLSWTSSLNTPPYLSPTVILSKKNISVCPGSLSVDQHVIFVRKLFPSLSNTAGTVLSPEKTEPSIQANTVDCHQPVEEEEEGSVWRQTLPDAIEDEDVRSTVASVLDGSEEILSILFSNRRSALRRVKAKERIKRKQSSSSKELDLLTMVTKQSRQKAEDKHNKDTTVSIISKQTGGVVETQWTPISLSDISDCDSNVLSPDTAETAKMQPNHLTVEQQTIGPGGSQLVGPGVKSTLECFSIKKTRKFVYCVGTPQPPPQGEELQKTNGSHAHLLGVGEGEPSLGELSRNTTDVRQQQEQQNVFAPPIPAKDHDFDMSQLCGVFAQDFSQTGVSCQPDRKKKDGYAVCPSTVRQMKPHQSTKQESNWRKAVQHLDFDDTINGRLTCFSQSSIPTSKLEGKLQNSGYLSTITTQMNDFSNQCWGFTTGNNTIISVAPQALQKAKMLFNDFHRDTVIDTNPSINQAKQGSAPSDETSLCTVNNFAKPLNTVKRYTNTELKLEDRVHDKQETLTPSQSADVKELSTLFENVGSQFEFTQFKSPELNSNGPERVPPRQPSKELDPDFLQGMDFDDAAGFSSKRSVKMASANKMKATSHGKEYCEVPIHKIKSTSFCSSVNCKEKVTNGKPPSITCSSSENKVGLFDMDMSDIKKLPVVSEGFKTAGGKNLQVSEQCLSKVRALFADLGESREKDRNRCCDGPVMTIIPSSLKLKVEEDLDVDHVNSVNGNTFDSIDLMYIEDEILSDSTGNHNPIHRIQLQSIEGGFPIVTTVHLSDSKEDMVVQHEEPGKSTLNSLHSHQTNGFQMASGKGVTISSLALQEASSFFKDCDVLETVGCGSLTQDSGVQQGVSAICNSSFEEYNCVFDTTGKEMVPMSDKTSTNHQQDRDSGLKRPRTKTPTVSAESLLSDRTSSLNIKPPHECVPLPSGCELSTASGKRITVSDGAIQNAKVYLSEFNEDQFEKKKISLSHTSPMKMLTENNSGFKTANGKGVTLSAKTIDQAKTFFKDCDFSTESPSVKTIEKYDEQTDAHVTTWKCNGGFTTAGGKKVHVSKESLSRAKTLLSEVLSESPKRCGGNINLNKPTREKASGLAIVSDLRYPLPIEHDAGVKQQPSTHPDFHTDGLVTDCAFSTACGKTVCVSDNSQRKAKSLLHECDSTGKNDFINNDRMDSANTSSLKFPEKPLFYTANRKPMPVSVNAHPEVKSVFSLCETSGVSNDTVAASNAKCHLGFSTASGKGVCVSEKALKEALEKFKECEDNPVSEKSHQKTAEERSPFLTTFLRHDQQVLVKASRPEDCEMFQTMDVKHQEMSSSLNCESLGHSGCTFTQQKYFAQEAIDSIKALLDDEDLSGQNKTLQENSIHSEQSSDRRVNGKRSGEDVDMKDQPPLKRLLLPEFERIQDGNRRPTIKPVKSCSHGMQKDRRVFKYRISLQPNVTTSYRDSMSHVELTLNKPEPQSTGSVSAHGDIRPRTAKAAVFVPPFRKNVRTEIQNSSDSHEKDRTPLLVPQFGKWTGQVTERDPQPPNNKTTHHLFKTLSKTSEMETDYNSKKNTQKLDPQLKKKINRASGDEEKYLNVATDPAQKDTLSESLTSEQIVPDSQGTKPHLQNLHLAQDMQNMRIRKKKCQTIRPIPGSLFLAKTSGVARVTLREAVRGRCPVKHTSKQLYLYGVHRHVSQISSENAESFRFHCQHFFKSKGLVDGVQIADGGWLIPRDDGSAGKEEFYRALCDTPGVDPKLISEQWVYNHYRWVVWKQAAMERCFPEVMGSLCLTPEQLLLQLKYRYDMEVDNCHRPALRKIMERDDTVAKTLVLCVCGVVSRGQSRPSQPEAMTLKGADCKAESSLGVIWLTDGWYAIKAWIDVPLAAMLAKGRLAIGGKVVIHGAQLVGPQTACSPLEAPDTLMLKIWANGTRPARWDAKLGFHSDPRPFILPLSSLYSDGGPVGCIDMVVLRSYPVQWMEKKPDGRFVFRNGRAEEKEARRHSDSRHKEIDVLFAKVQAQFEKEEKGKRNTKGRRGSLCRQDIERLQDGEGLHEAMENDPVSLQACLSKQQLETLNNYRRSLGEKRQIQLQERIRRALEAEGRACPNREVTPVWKLCIADSRDQRGTSGCMLSVWRPSLDLQSYLKEGCRYRAHHLSMSESKKRASLGTIQLTTTKKTQFQDIQASQELLSRHFHARVAARFHDFCNPEFQPLCGEVDIVGYVMSITYRQGSSSVIYLVDGKLDFVKVHLYSSLAQLGLEDLVKPLALLALSNLQLRHPSSPIPDLHAGDLALFSSNPKDTHLQEVFTQLRTLVQGQEHFFQNAEERLSHLIPSHELSSVPHPALLPRTSAWNTHQDEGTNMTPQQTVRGFGPFTPSNRNFSPLVCSSVEKDPKSLKRKRDLDYLCRIPAPPPISPLGTMTSPCVNKRFKPPRRSGTPGQTLAPRPAPKHTPPDVEGEWVNDEELAMIDTQVLHSGLRDEEV